MPAPVRILHVFGTVNRGGAESRVMDLYRHFDRVRIQFDFLVHTEARGHFEEEIESLGGRIYRVPRFRMVNIFAYRKAMKDFFGNHSDFRCVQGHMTSTAAIYLPIAKACGIPVTIAHARSAGVDRGIKGWITRLMRLNLRKKTDYMFICSQLAGEAVFGKKAIGQKNTVYIPNAIEASRFRFDKQVRDDLRERLGLVNQLVVGHVGRFDYAKNHEFLLQIFFELQKKHRESKLVLLGDGAGKAAIEKTAGELGIGYRVLFLGNQRAIQDYYQIMDYFVFPSRFEGLPGTVIEAQAAGLKCLISDTIAKEVLITDLVRTDSIRRPPSAWAETILETAGYVRKDMAEAVMESGFDVEQQIKKMMDFYENANPFT